MMTSGENSSKNRAGVLFIVLVMSLSAGCVTIPNFVQPTAIPAVVHEQFKNCSPRDGALQLGLDRGIAGKFQFDAEWIAKNKLSWEAQFFDPFGRMMIGIKNNQEQILSYGPKATLLPKIQTENGNITIKKHFTGLRVEEVPCLFAAVLPQDWLYRVTEFRKMGPSVTGLKIYYPDRDISIVIREESDYSRVETCSQVSWSSYLGTVSHNLNWCFEKGLLGESTLKFNDMALSWKNKKDVSK